MVFQNYALFPHMTVYENLEFPLQCHKVDKSTREKKIAEALAMVELTGFEKRRPNQLSRRAAAACCPLRAPWCSSPRSS